MLRVIFWLAVLMPWSLAMAPAQTGAEEAVPTSDEALEVEPLRLSMEFQAANLGEVLKAFSKQTGINVIAGDEITDRPVTIFFEEVGVLDALDQILRAGNLTYERPSGSDIYVVKPIDEAPTRTITRIYRLKYARVSESVFAKAAKKFGDQTPFEATLETEASSSGGGGEEGGGAGGAAGGGAAGGEEAASQGVGVDTVLERLLTDEGKIVVDSRTNRLIVTDVPENFPKLEAALAALDVRTVQILVDAEVIETGLNKIKDLGIEWGTGAEGTMLSFTPATRTTYLPFGNWFGNHGFRRTGDTDTSVTVGSLGLNQAVAALQMLESDKDTKILARPKVLTLDNESAVIRLTTNETIGFTESTAATTGVQTSTPERERTGVVLVVTPQVNDNEYITMIVEPSVTKTVPSQITPPSGQATTRDARTRTSRTIVRIRSGDTLVVGGLIDRSEEETLRKVPILSGMPFLGEAFKNAEISDNSSELIVFMTPRILGDLPETQVASTGQAPFAMREQDTGEARQALIEQTMNRLE